jgi:hypothetical protein
VVRLDPANAAVVSQRVLGTAPQLYGQANLSSVTADATWVSSFSADAMHRLAPG